MYTYNVYIYINTYLSWIFWAILAAQNLTALAASGGPVVLPPAQGGQSGSSWTAVKTGQSIDYKHPIVWFK